MESVALIDCKFAVTVTGTPPLFCTYALARVALPPRCKREIPLCDACRGGREGDALTTFFFFLSLPLPSSPLAQLEEKKTQAQPFSLHASLLSARAAREEPTATLFSFPSTLLQLGIITRAPTCVRIDSGCRGVTN